MHLLGRYYRQVEAGRKTIEVRTATPDKRAGAVGDTVCVVVPGRSLWITPACRPRWSENDLDRKRRVSEACLRVAGCGGMPEAGRVRASMQGRGNGTS